MYITHPFRIKLKKYRKLLMAFYEATFIFRQDVGKADVDALVEELSAVVKKAGAKLLKTEHWGLHILAYRVNKNRKGHYVMLGIEGDGAVIEALRYEARVNDNILRFMSVRVEAIDEKPSPLADNANDDEAEAA
jgi:small subunit ribosomal protein S6